MGDIAADFPTGVSLADIVARIDRNQAEIQKLSEETRKFVTEQHKLSAEAGKLTAEARKLDRDRGLAPWQVTAIIAGSVGAFIASAVSLAKSLGVF
jgi:hypothetical protein